MNKEIKFEAWQQGGRFLTIEEALAWADEFPESPLRPWMRDLDGRWYGCDESQDQPLLLRGDEIPVWLDEQSRDDDGQYRACWFEGPTGGQIPLTAPAHGLLPDDRLIELAVKEAFHIGGLRVLLGTDDPAEQERRLRAGLRVGLWRD